MEQQARTPVRAHQGRLAGARREGRHRGRDRRSHGEQGASTFRRGRAGKPRVGAGHLIRSPRRAAVTSGFRRTNKGPAVQRGEAQGHLRPLQDVEGAAGASAVTLTGPYICGSTLSRKKLRNPSWSGPIWPTYTSS